MLIRKITKSFMMCSFLLLSLGRSIVQAQEKITRKPLLTAAPIDRFVTRTEVKEIDFKPSQKTGLHLHPCPVTGYIAEGSVIFQIKGKPRKLLKKGDAFFEPAMTQIVHFDNASAKAPLKFVAFYLINKEKELIQMLPEDGQK